MRSNLLLSGMGMAALSLALSSSQGPYERYPAPAPSSSKRPKNWHRMGPPARGGSTVNRSARHKLLLKGVRP